MTCTVAPMLWLIRLQKQWVCVWWVRACVPIFFLFCFVLFFLHFSLHTQSFPFVCMLQGSRLMNIPVLTLQNRVWVSLVTFLWRWKEREAVLHLIQVNAEELDSFIWRLLIFLLKMFNPSSHSESWTSCSSVVRKRRKDRVKRITQVLNPKNWRLSRATGGPEATEHEDLPPPLPPVSGILTLSLQPSQATFNDYMGEIGEGSGGTLQSKSPPYTGEFYEKHVKFTIMLICCCVLKAFVVVLSNLQD